MKKQTKIEIWVGAFVLMGLISLLVLAFQVSNLTNWKGHSTYEISAMFDNVGGLKVRSPVKLSGVVIGRITSVVVDPVSFRAQVKMSIEQHFDRLPLDSSASILTSGLLGDQYIGLDPGGDEEVLVAGDEVDVTQSAIVLEELVGHLLVKFGEGE